MPGQAADEQAHRNRRNGERRTRAGEPRSGVIGDISSEN